MALDDLMSCMRSGMKYGFALLMLMALALGLAPKPGAADRSVGSTAEESPPRQPNTRAVDQEWSLWSGGLYCHMLDDEIPLVRLRAFEVLRLRADGPNATRCADTLPDATDFRLSTLLDAPDNPALVAAVYRLECGRPRPAAWCWENDLRQRLLELDPGNAYAHILFLESPTRSVTASGVTTFSGEQLEHLLAAASSERLDSYWGHGMPEAMVAVEDYLAAQTAPEWSAEALAELEQLGGGPLNVLEMASMELFALENQLPLTGWTAITGQCQAARKAGDKIGMAGCEGLASVAENNGNTLLGRRIGAALARQSRCETTDCESDPWRSTIRTVILMCEQPRAQPFFSSLPGHLPGPMPEGETLLYLEDLAEFGEVVALERKVAREYARYPEAFPLDPARCDAIRSLPAEEQQKIAAAVTDFDSNDPEQAFRRWDRALELAAGYLD